MNKSAFSKSTVARMYPEKAFYRWLADSKNPVRVQGAIPPRPKLGNQGRLVEQLFSVKARLLRP